MESIEFKLILSTKVSTMCTFDIQLKKFQNYVRQLLLNKYYIYYFCKYCNDIFDRFT